MTILAQCPCSGGDAGAGPLVLFGLVACAVWLVYGIARKDGVSCLSKVWKIAIVVGLVAVLAGVVVSQQRGSSPAAGETAPSGGAVETRRTVAGLPRLLDLGSVSCIPCKRMAPILEELKREYAGRFDVEFIDVGLRENQDLARRYGIRLIPTQIFFDAEGNELWRHEGFLGKDEILARWRELGVTFKAR